MGAYATERENKTVTETLFGKDLKSGKAWSILVLRVFLGFVFLWAGYEKITKEWGSPTPLLITKGFLSHVSGPFAFLFTGMAGNPVVDALLVYGELAIGISLVFGLFTRVGSISGALMTLLLYMSTLPAMTPGFTGSYFDFLMANNALVSYYVVYIFVFVAFFFLVPGRFLGLDGILQTLTDRSPTLSRILKTVG